MTKPNDRKQRSTAPALLPCASASAMHRNSAASGRLTTRIFLWHFTVATTLLLRILRAFGCNHRPPVGQGRPSCAVRKCTFLKVDNTATSATRCTRKTLRFAQRKRGISSMRFQKWRCWMAVPNGSPEWQSRAHGRETFTASKGIGKPRQVDFYSADPCRCR